MMTFGLKLYQTFLLAAPGGSKFTELSPSFYPSAYDQPHDKAGELTSLGNSQQPFIQ